MATATTPPAGACAVSPSPDVPRTSDLSPVADDILEFSRPGPGEGITAVLVTAVLVTVVDAAPCSLSAAFGDIRSASVEDDDDVEKEDGEPGAGAEVSLSWHRT